MVSFECFEGDRCLEINWVHALFNLQQLRQPGKILQFGIGTVCMDAFFIDMQPLRASDTHCLPAESLGRNKILVRVVADIDTFPRRDVECRGRFFKGARMGLPELAPPIAGDSHMVKAL